MAKKQIATFLGPNKGLSIAGEHAYAYSGSVAVNNTTVECLNFTTGKELIVAELSQAVNYSQVGNGKLVGFNVKLNGIVVATNLEATQTFGTNENNEPSRYSFIIPPLTQVQTEATTNGEADIEFFHSIVGRVYA